jgi:probable lipoprotein NlpC
MKPLVFLWLAIFHFMVLDGLAQPRQAARQTQTKRQREADIVISTARTYLGTPYKYGGTTRKGIDCSALIIESFKAAGYNLPRSAHDQSTFGKNVKIGKIQPGDLVFFKFKQKGENTWHSGLITVVEKNKIRFIHSSSSKGVIESDLLSDYYKSNIKGFRRVL